MPQSLVAAKVYLLGNLLYWIPGKRKCALLSNLHHSFPDRPEQWRRKMARISCQRCLEMGFFALASSYFSKRRLKKQFSTSKAFGQALQSPQFQDQPTLLLIPHFSLMDAVSTVPAFHEGFIPETGVIYRPLRNKTLENWVKSTRERFGVRLLSRKKGFTEAMSILRKNGIVTVLFDQNAGYPGLLTTFMDRLASTTELPALLAKKFQPSIHIVFPRRRGFWSAEIDTCPIQWDPQSNPNNVLFSANQWLENALKSDDNLCADWLWLHKRWNNQDDWNRRFRIQAKRNAIQETLAFNNLKELPRVTRYWIRMPNWLGDVVMALSLIRALRESRPDAEITLLSKKAFVPLLEKLNLAKKILPLPNKKERGYWRYFWNLRKEYPEVQFQFINSFRGDLEAYIIGAPQRFGMLRPNKKRPLLTHTWKLPEGLDETHEHQTYVWDKCFEHFGLQNPLDRKPLDIDLQQEPINGTIGLICGTENMPEKRWPIEHWRSLIQQLLNKNASLNFKLFGTPNDAAITQQVAADLPSQSIEDLAGKTDLLQFIKGLKSCQAIICNDTGGMHLANMLGIPVIAIFGPTNPLRTGPIYEAPKTILQPYGCPATGGQPIQHVSPERVAQATENFIQEKTLQA